MITVVGFQLDIDVKTVCPYKEVRGKNSLK